MLRAFCGTRGTDAQTAWARWGSRGDSQPVPRKLVLQGRQAHKHLGVSLRAPASPERSWTEPQRGSRAQQPRSSQPTPSSARRPPGDRAIAAATPSTAAMVLNVRQRQAGERRRRSPRALLPSSCAAAPAPPDRHAPLSAPSLPRRRRGAHAALQRGAGGQGGGRRAGRGRVQGAHPGPAHQGDQAHGQRGGDVGAGAVERMGMEEQLVPAA